VIPSSVLILQNVKCEPQSIGVTDVIFVKSIVCEIVSNVLKH
jgi:hypothetical protein